MSRRLTSARSEKRGGPGMLRLSVKYISGKRGNLVNLSWEHLQLLRALSAALAAALLVRALQPHSSR